MKVDPYKHEERYKKWLEKVKSEGIEGISKENSDITIQYVTDMEHGLNVSSKNVRGGRSFIRLNTIKEKMIYFSKKFKEIYGLEKITDITEDQLVLFFSKMQKGDILRKDGKRYLSTNYFVKVFKAFWHWHQTVNRKKGIILPDITIDLDTRGEKPKWVYLTEEQVKKLFDNAKPLYKSLIMFLLDSGIRSPTELMNVKVSDLYNDCEELQIREEASKTFGRKIKLMICSDLLRQHVKENELGRDDYLFAIKPQSVNKYLKRLSKRILGDGKSLAGEYYSNLTMYDFRHVSCCYWMPRYKSESALKYRFGWKKSDKIHYYSELLGMKDTITEDDMFVDVTKTDLEKQLNESNNKREMLQEQVHVLEEQMVEIRNKLLGIREEI
jgi:hypothetical protein